MKTLLSIFLISIFFTCSYSNIYSQSGTWTWVKGDSIIDAYGNFREKGIAIETNNPRATYDCAYWIDTAGKFWIYGGGWDGFTAMWQFDPKTLIWTWLSGDSAQQYIQQPPDTAIIHAAKGIYDSLNWPGELNFNMFTWVTLNNHLWLYGGQSAAFQPYSSLWQYSPEINQWAWMGTFGPPNYGTKGLGDSTTMPGMRDEGNSAWTDSGGNLWFFGGFDYEGHMHNDMWEYDITNGIWTWMSGSMNGDDPGIYGAIGHPSINNYPAARSTNMFWKDDSGNFWLAGGVQYTNDIMFQDIWKFNPRTLEWTWIKGVQGKDTVTAGVDCSIDSIFKDGPRYENSVWKVYDDFVITYGGFYDLDSLDGPNDLWAYKMSSNKWMKISDWPVTGSYGIRGVPNPTNHPTQRHGAVGFTDRDNNLWMFGGQFYYPYLPGHYLAGYYNDLWKYTLDTACINAAFAAVNNITVEPQVSIYPNPNSIGSWQLSVTGELIGSKLQMYNTGGGLVFHSAIQNLRSEIPSNALPAGVYFLQISSANTSIVKKLVKL